MMRVFAPEPVANDATAGRAAAAANRHEHEVHALERLEDFRRVGADSGDEQGLVGVVHVAPPFARGEVFDPFARLVEVAPVLDDLGAKRADRRNLVGVVRPPGTTMRQRTP